MATEKQIKDLDSIVETEPQKSSLHGVINHTPGIISFGLSGFSAKGVLLPDKEWKKLLSEKKWKKLAKDLYKYENFVDKFFIFVSPNKSEEVKLSCTKSGHFQLCKEELYFYKRKDGNGWTDFLPMADKKLGKFIRITIKLTPTTIIKLGRINELKVFLAGTLVSAAISLWIDFFK